MCFSSSANNDIFINCQIHPFGMTVSDSELINKSFIINEAKKTAQSGNSIQKLNVSKTSYSWEYVLSDSEFALTEHIDRLNGRYMLTSKSKYGYKIVGVGKCEKINPAM